MPVTMPQVVNRMRPPDKAFLIKKMLILFLSVKTYIFGTH